MKVKAIVLSIAMVAGIFSANAQECKKTNDVFVGIGGGITSVMTNTNDGFSFNSIAPTAQIQVGAYVTPVWGVRGVIAGPFQNLDKHDGSFLTYGGNSTLYESKNKLFGELDFDAMFNIVKAFNKGQSSVVDLYLFAGPSMNLSSKGTKFTGVTSYDGILEVEEADGCVARFGATAGLGLGFNLSPKFALAIEGRAGINPSIFGDASLNRKAESNGRLTLNGVWTIGGKHSKSERVDAAAKCAGYLTPAEAAALAAAAVENNPKIVEKVVEKEVIKYVDKVVEKEAHASEAVFFQINKTAVTPADKARLKLFADEIKGCDCKFTVTGYADKATGSASTNQKLSEKRAQSVYDFLVSEGVAESRLTKDAKGGVEAMFLNNDALSRCVIVAPAE